MLNLLKRRKRMLLAGAVFLGLAGVAAAQVIGVPLVTTAHPFLDLLQIIPNGNPVVGNQYSPWGQVTAVYGYYKSPTSVGTGFIYQFGCNNAPGGQCSNGVPVTYAQFGNSGAVTNAYIYLPSAPLDGQRACIFSIGGFTNVALYGGTTSQTVNNGITAATALTQYCYEYSASNTTWDRD